MTQPSFSIRFWGVRGSIPCPGPDYSRFGGNTSCVEVRCGERVLVLDAGSGAVPLGKTLAGQPDQPVDLFLSHCHYDHICGLPFFAPLYCEGRKVRIWSGHLRGAMSTEEMVRAYMRAPFFPIGPEVFTANVAYEDFHPGDRLEPKSGIAIDTLALNHPNGAVGYRIRHRGHTLCYVTDTEHPTSGHDKELLDFIRGADLVVYDGTYTESEYEECRGYGHSTWQEGARLCAMADVKRYAVFHHCHTHSDSALQKIADAPRKGPVETIFAREGEEITF